jgi:predicted transcriptional regulator
MLSQNELKAFNAFPKTITQLSEKLNISKPAAYAISEKLVQKGLAQKNRQGKKVIVSREKTLHAQDLKEIQQNIERLPINQILSQTSLPIISLLDYPLRTKEITQILNITRQWTSKQLKKLGEHGLILKEKKEYTINPVHQKIQRFASHYYQFQHNQHVAKIADDTQIIWQHGPEFLFSTKKKLSSFPFAALSAFSSYNLPLISNTYYYFHSERPLDISDIIIQTLLTMPQSKTYYSYACLLYEEKTPKNILKKARLYNVTDRIKDMITFLKTKQPIKYSPEWKDYETLAKQYGVR